LYFFPLPQGQGSLRPGFTGYACRGVLRGRRGVEIRLERIDDVLLLDAVLAGAIECRTC